MAKLGTNLRCVADATSREAIAKFYTEVFDAEVSSPAPDLEVYSFGGSNIGVYFVPDGEALTAEQQEKLGTWIEVLVHNIDATAAALEERGFSQLSYHDPEHRYYQAPGGQVFRLATG